MRKCLGLLPLLFVGGAALADPPPVHREDVIHRAAAMFDKSDTNHDGWLTLDEYHRALAAIARAKSATPTAEGWAKADAQFAAVDQAHLGRIARQQFIDAAVAHTDGADLNHDGVVTPDEARKAASIKRRHAKEQDKAARAAVQK